MSGNIPQRDQKILCLKSGNCCALPECRQKLVINKISSDKESIIGEMAHISGEKPSAARYDKNMTEKERNCYENLILVCSNHHKVIDDQLQTFTVEKLYEIKKNHEQWVDNVTRQEMPNVTFAELNVVTKYLASGQYTTDDSLVLIPPKDKIKKNGLSQEITNLITQGMVQVKQVGDYILKVPDIDFGERLKDGFVSEYQRLKNVEKITGDDLFNGLFEFATRGCKDFKQRAAGLAVLVYLFEKCEVFEK
jgi:hypothetical protein